ncbi:MAG: S8 family serine peptidase, partial [Roseiflexaceae bacterium]|nr:S8 family serine peptidase [Roseiflexaceae bacterium]
MLPSPSRLMLPVRKVALLALCLLPLLFSSAFVSDIRPQRQLLRLQSGSFDPLLDRDPSSRLQLADATEIGPYYILQFNGPISDVWAAQIELLGAELLGYVPDNAAIARIAAEDVAKVQDMYALRWMGSYRAGYKIAPDLAVNPALRARASTPVDVLIAAFPGEPLDATRQALIGLGANIRSAAATPLAVVFQAAVPATSLPAIAQQPSVSWIETTHPLEVTNGIGRELMNVGSVWTNQKYFGEGQIVAVSDSGLSVQGAMSPDFDGRVIRAYAPSEMNLSEAECQAKTDYTDLSGHGTHVAGSILGNGSAGGSNPAARQYSDYAGVAPEAKIVFMSLAAGGGGSLECVDENADFLA